MSDDSDVQDEISFCHTIDSQLDYNVLLQSVLTRHAESNGRTIHVPPPLRPVLGKASIHAKSIHAGATHWYGGVFDPMSRYADKQWPAFEQWEHESRKETDKLARQTEFGDDTTDYEK